MPVEHFKSEEAYRKNLAYRHMHEIPMTASRVCIKNDCHEVKHSRKGERLKIDNAQRKRKGEKPLRAKRGY